MKTKESRFKCENNGGGGNQKVENNIATFHRIHWYQYFGNKNKTDNFDFRLYWK